MGGRTPGVKSIAEIEHGALYVIFWIRAIRVDCNHKRSFPARARELHRTSGRSIGGRSDDNSLACGSGAADGIGGGQYDVKRARSKIYMRATGLLRASSIAPANDCTYYVILAIATLTIGTHRKRHRATAWRYAQRASGRHVR